jgi:gluconate kinase
VIVIVFRVSGAGKTTIGKLLAEQLGWGFCEADDFHPTLLQSQFDDLEEPQPDEHGLTIQLGRMPEEVVDRIEAKLRLANSD